MPQIPVGLSVSSVFPEDVPRAFELAAELGFDGVEVVVTAEPLTKDAARLSDLVTEFDMPVLSIHAPVLLVTARVWGTDPVGKVTRSLELAADLGATTVVTHPPFAWQRKAARTFTADIARLSSATDIRIAVENMFPVQIGGRVMNGYRPHWDVADTGYPHYTLDLSHTAASRVDGLEMAQQMGAGLAHIHLGDGSGALRDEHLVPGTGVAACAPVLEYVGGQQPAWPGTVILEISTRLRDAVQRREDLTASLAFARQHLGQQSAQ